MTYSFPPLRRRMFNVAARYHGLIPTTMPWMVPTSNRLSVSCFTTAVEVKRWMEDNQISCSGQNMPAPLLTFQDGQWPEWINKAVAEQGFKTPTLIQSISWGVALQGRDMIGIAATGSGKTLGFVLPCLMTALKNPCRPREGPSSVVVCPTRELAQQTFKAINALIHKTKLRAVCVFGGAPKSPQADALRLGVDIVVCTPGRLIDLLDMRASRLDRVAYLVLDEADRMLDMGFQSQIQDIFKQCPTSKQTLMWSATWPKEVRNLAAEFLRDPVHITVGSQDLTANKDITQKVIVCTRNEKSEQLRRILDEDLKGKKVLIFVATKKGADYLQEDLSEFNHRVLCIHGDKSQAMRDQAIDRFRASKGVIMVATDVAARGLDVRDVDAVINYDFPGNIEDYIHRIGRTGRAGAKGVAFSLLTSQDASMVKPLIRVLEEAGQEVPDSLRSMMNLPGQAPQRRRLPGGRPTGPRGSHSRGGSFGVDRRDSNKPRSREWSTWTSSADVADRPPSDGRHASRFSGGKKSSYVNRGSDFGDEPSMRRRSVFDKSTRKPPADEW